MDIGDAGSDTVSLPDPDEGGRDEETNHRLSGGDQGVHQRVHRYSGARSEGEGILDAGEVDGKDRIV